MPLRSAEWSKPGEKICAQLRSIKVSRGTYLLSDQPSLGDTLDHWDERLETGTVLKLKLKFRDPSELLDTGWFSEQGTSAAVLARGGPQFLPLWTGNVLHLVYDTDQGCVMRSRFWMGDVSPAVPVLSGLIRKDISSDDALSDLYEHWNSEMQNLARLLPALYSEAV